jgi:subtilase family serine protease
MMRTRATRRFRPRWDLLDERCMLFGYTPAQITAAYGLNAISFTSSTGAKVTGNGTGQTIALIEVYHDPNIQAAVDVFDTMYGLPAVKLDVINQAGNQVDPGWAGEESLDVEWAHAIAPDANILVVEASPGTSDASGFKAMMTAIETAVSTKGVSVVSMSFGGDEFSGESAQDPVFATAGITFIASSGDSGTVEWPSVSPDVLAVGGTTLKLSSAGAILSEVGWAGAGGGLGQNEPEPAYQKVVQSTGDRTTPDVAFDADPTTGVSAYYISPSSTTGQGEWGSVGGTSVGAPSWAGILAIINQGRVLSGQATLTGATETLPAIYELRGTDFNKTPLTPASGGGITNQAINTPNYNTQTGLGSPVGLALITDLVDAPGTSSPPPSPPSPPPTPTNPPPPVLRPPPISFPNPTPISNPLPPITYVPPSTPAPTPGPTPTTPPPAAPPKALPRKQKAQSSTKKHHAKPVLAPKPKAAPKKHAAVKTKASLHRPG